MLARNNENRPVSLINKSGTTLANPIIVKTSITYKELTMILGIAVAMFVLFNLWLRTPESNSSPSAPSVSFVGVDIKLPSAKTVIQAATEVIF